MSTARGRGMGMWLHLHINQTLITAGILITEGSQSLSYQVVVTSVVLWLTPLGFIHLGCRLRSWVDITDLQPGTEVLP